MKIFRMTMNDFWRITSADSNGLSDLFHIESLNWERALFGAFSA
jgi:hypothetical protein